MDSKNAFRRFPSIQINGYNNAVTTDRNSICSQISILCQNNTKTVIVAECYLGVDQNELKRLFSSLKINTFIHNYDLALPPVEIDAQIKRELTEDLVFGIITAHQLKEFYPIENLEKSHCQIKAISSGIVLVYGMGSSLMYNGDILIWANITRWEIQLRYRQGLSNWRTTHTNLSRSKKIQKRFLCRMALGRSHQRQNPFQNRFLCRI